MAWIIVLVLFVVLCWRELAMRDKDREIGRLQRRINQVEFKLTTYQDEEAVQHLKEKYRQDKKIDYWVDEK